MTKFTVWKVSLFLTALSGCSHQTKAPEPVLSFPPVKPSEVQVLSAEPARPYIKIGSITYQERAEIPRERAINSARLSAAAQGGSAIVILPEAFFESRAGNDRFRMRRQVIRVIHYR